MQGEQQPVVLPLVSVVAVRLRLGFSLLRQSSGTGIPVRGMWTEQVAALSCLLCTRRAPLPRGSTVEVPASPRRQQQQRRARARQLSFRWFILYSVI